MKRLLLPALFVAVVAPAATLAQVQTSSAPPVTAAPIVRPRTVTKPVSQTPIVNSPVAAPKPSPTSTPNPIPSNAPNAGVINRTSVAQTSITPLPQIAPVLPLVVVKPLKPLAASKVDSHIDEAKRLLRGRVQLTAYTVPNMSFVTLALLDPDSSQMHTLIVPKNVFIKRGAEMQLTTSLAMSVRMRVLRPNYVNTAVQVFDLTGRQLVPLVVEYPLEKFGKFREMGYYTSAHPTLVTPELVRDGQNYVRTMIELAAKRLKDKGKFIAPEILDVAERLAIVEHVDHQRFLTENRKTLYEEIYALFALNKLDTYRYSVSTAGAGGMVQMIPPTYYMVRQQHPSVGLNPDFVLGMRNHGNALEAMLLYMQDTWSALLQNADVSDAYYSSKLAARHELLAAGYNSNPMNLGKYIRRGGAGWRTLIPRETQMYLQIYSSFESLIPIKKRVEDKPQTSVTTSGNLNGVSVTAN